MEHEHHLPEFLHFLEELIEEHSVLRGMVFGFIHTLIPLIGFYTGWSINRFLKLVSNGAIAGIIYLKYHLKAREAMLPYLIWDKIH